jgi:hypothetical protein
MFPIIPFLMTAALQTAPAAQEDAPKLNCTTVPARISSIRGIEGGAFQYPSAGMVFAHIDAGGKLVDASVYQSVSNMESDQAMLHAVVQATYAPAISDCRPTPAKLIVYFTSLRAGADNTVSLPSHWCQIQDARPTMVVVSDIPVSAAALQTSSDGSQHSEIRFPVAADGSIDKSAIETIAATGNADLDQAAIGAALSRKYTTQATGCGASEVDVLFIPAFIAAPATSR